MEMNSIDLRITFIVAIGVVILSVIGMAAWRIVQFWIGVARGVNEATGGGTRGFEVKLNTGEPPVPRDLEKDETTHG